MGSVLPVPAKMLLTILLLNIVLYLSNADAKSTQEQGCEDLENLVENLLETKMQSERERMELRLKEMEKNMKEKIQELETRLESKDKEMEEFKDNMKEEREAWISKLRLEVDESLMKDSDTNNSTTGLTKPTLSSSPFLLISAWQPHDLRSPQTVTFESFLANYVYDNGGGDGGLDLDSGVFTCITPGYYTVSFSAYSHVGPSFDSKVLCLYKNGIEVAESRWLLSTHSVAVNDWIAVTGSRIVILRMDGGDTLELRMTQGNYVEFITINIELTGF